MDIKSKKYLNIFYTIVVIVIVTSFIFYRNLTPTLSKGEGATQKYNPLPTSPSGGAINAIEYVTVEGRKYKVEVLDTDEGRRQGLSSTSPDYLCGASNMSIGGVAGCGMLFVWNDEGDRVMWMKDMNYPLDMYWLDHNMNVVHVEHDIATNTYNKNDERSSALFGRGYMSQYVLETRAYK